MAEWYEKLDEEIVKGLADMAMSTVGVENIVRGLSKGLDSFVGLEERFALANKNYSYQRLLYQGDRARVSANTCGSSIDLTRVYYVEDNSGLVTRIPVHRKLAGAR